MATTRIFDPPLVLVGRPDTTIRTLGQAADFLRDFKGARRPISQDGVLRRIESAGTAEAQKEAAKIFRDWAESENLLVP